MAAATFDLTVDVAELAGTPVEDARVVVEAMVTPEGNGVVVDPSTGRLYVTEQYDLPNGVGTLTLPRPSAMSPAGYQYRATLSWRREGDRARRSVRIVFNEPTNSPAALGKLAPQSVLLPPTYFPNGLPGPQGAPGTPGVGQVNLPELARNLAANPSLETQLAPWTGAGGYLNNPAACSRESPGSVGRGTWVGYVSADGSVGQQGAQYVTSDGIKPDTTYTVSVMTYDASGTVPTLLWLRDNSNNVTVQATTRRAVGETSRLLRAVIHTGPQQPLLQVGLTTAQGAGVVGSFYFDSLSITEGDDPLDYFDGGMAGCYWTGAAHASVSVKGLWDADDVMRAEHMPELARNLVPNPRTQVGGSNNTGLHSMTPGYSVSDHPAGLTSVGIGQPVAGTNNGDVFSVYSSDNLGNSPVARYVGMWVKTAYTGLSAQVYTSGDVSGTLVQVPLNPGAWTFVKTTKPATGYMIAGVFVTNGGDAPDAYTALLGGVIASTEPILDYFDGDTPGCRWTGARNASESVRMLPARKATLADAPVLGTNLYPKLVSDTSGTLSNGWVVNSAATSTEGGGKLNPQVWHVDPQGFENWGYLHVQSVKTLGMIDWPYDVPTTMSVRVRSSTEQTLCLRDYGDGHTEGPAVVCPAGQWRRLFVGVKANGGGNNYLSVRRPGFSGVAPGAFDVEALQVEAGTAPTEYINGDQPGCRWTGARRQSTSVRVLASKADVDLLVWLDAGRAQGVGSPVGKVVAPVGTRYVDTAATLGAVEWLKMGGTDAYGWVCTEGNTGLRNVSALLTNGATASSVTLRRRNGRVILRVVQIKSVGAYNPALQVGAGFAAGSQFDMLRDDVETGRYAAWLMDYRSLMYISEVVPGSLFTSGSGFGGTIAWDTEDPWPTALPGDPA